ncbi:MAG: T9SS type A sorting domain-containing protein [candidate division Zixibacteria bacterium]|nr:T9SS type A sorting domain-containing protein [candidate division Zixibacteria bacterium]
MTKKLNIFILQALICLLGTAWANSSAYTGKVAIESKIVKPGESFTVKLVMDDNNYPFAVLRIPLKFSSSYLTCSYVDFSNSIKPSNMEGYSKIGNDGVEISYIPTVVYPIPKCTIDSGLIATLYLTAAAEAPDMVVKINAADIDSLLEWNGMVFHLWKRIELSDTLGTTVYSPSFTSGTIEIIHLSNVNDDDIAIPGAFELSQNYPNPFNPSTQISFRLAQRGIVRLEIYNLLGQRVAILANREFLAGKQSLTWDATRFPSGIYFYRLSIETKSLTRKMLLVK